MPRAGAAAHPWWCLLFSEQTFNTVIETPVASPSSLIINIRGKGIQAQKAQEIIPYSFAFLQIILALNCEACVCSLGGKTECFLKKRFLGVKSSRIMEIKGRVLSWLENIQVQSVDDGHLHLKQF